MIVIIKSNIKVQMIKYRNQLELVDKQEKV